MLRSVQRVLVAVVLLGGATLQPEPARAGVIPAVVEAVCGQFGYAGYAPTCCGGPSAYGGGYALSGGGCGSCGTVMYAPAASACCSPCGGICGSSCGSICGSSCGSACGGSPCSVAPSNGTTSSGKLAPTPDPNHTRSRAPQDSVTPAPDDGAYRRNRTPPVDDFEPRRPVDNGTAPGGGAPPKWTPGRSNSGTVDPADSGFGNEAAPPRTPRGGLPTDMESPRGFEPPVPRNSGTPGAPANDRNDGGLLPPDNAAPGDNKEPDTFKQDLQKPPIEGAEHVIPKRAAPIEADPVGDGAETPMENAGPRLEARKTSQAVAVKERLRLQPRFSAPTLVRAQVRPHGEWNTGVMTRLAGNP